MIVRIEKIGNTGRAARIWKSLDGDSAGIRHWISSADVRTSSGRAYAVVSVDHGYIWRRTDDASVARARAAKMHGVVVICWPELNRLGTIVKEV
jgi:hypothetical protein